MTIAHFAKAQSQVFTVNRKFYQSDPIPSLFLQTKKVTVQAVTKTQRKYCSCFSLRLGGLMAE